jgi:hypothetical protein
MNKTSESSEAVGSYQEAQLGLKSTESHFQTSSETGFSRSVCVPERGKTVMLRIVPRAPHPTERQLRTE